MKHNLLKSVILSVILLMGVSNAWAWSIYGNLYFNNMDNNWSNVSLIVGHDTWHQGYSFTKLNYTKLYYKWVDFSNFGDMYFVNANYTSSSSTKPYDIAKNYTYWRPWCADYTESKQWYFNGTNAVEPETLPKYTATVDFKVSRNGGSSYNVTNKKFGTITLKGTYMDGDAATGQSSATITGENKYNYDNIPVTGEFTLTNTALTNEAYEFVGFGTGDTPTDKVNTKTWNITGNTTYYVFYKHKLYTVTYSKGTYGSGSNQTANKLHGETLALADKGAFTRTGYTQTAWNTNTDGKSGTSYKLKANYTSNQAITLYPTWTANQSTITWNANGGSVTPASSTYTYDGAAVTLPTPTRNGYTFNGWYTAASGGTKITEIGTTNKPASNTTYYARWTENRYTVNIVANPAGAAKTLTLGSQQVGIKPVSIATTAKVGYTFKNWTATAGITIDNANNASTTITATKAGTVTANFEAQPSTIVYFKPNDNWKLDNARFAIYYWGANSQNGWVDMNEVGCDRYYFKGEIPFGSLGFNFVRMNPNTSANNWDNKWDQTGDLNIPTDNQNCFTITDDNWDDSNVNIAEGTWRHATFTVTLEKTAYGKYAIELNGLKYYSSQTEDVVIKNVPLESTLKLVSAESFNTAYNNNMCIQAHDGAAFKKIAIDANHTICGTTVIKENFSTLAAHTVYLRVSTTNDEIKNNWNQDEHQNYIYCSDNITGIVTGTVSLTEGEIYKESGYNYYKFVIPAGCRTFRFERKTAGNVAPTNVTESFTRYLPFEITNCYTIEGKRNDNDNFYGDWGMSLAIGDYRLLYVEQVVEKSKKAGDEWKPVITRKKAHPSDIIRKRTESGVDTVSLHTYKDRTYMANAGGSEYESSNNPEIILQKYLGNDQWQDVECQMVYGPLETLPIMANLPGRKNASPNSNIDDLQYQDGIENIKKDVLNHQDKGNGVWNFVVTQDGDNASVQWDQTHRYTGEYYIRTDVAEGGWMDYTIPSNYITYSQYAKDHSGFSHYFCRWVEKNITPNTKFVIANDYGVAISDTLAGDQFTDKHGNIQENANIRWSWNEATNEIARAYIQGAYDGQNQNANIVLDYTTDGRDNPDDVILFDTGDWIYSIDVDNVRVGSTLESITAKYPKTDYTIDGKVINPTTQIFEQKLPMLTGGDSENKYTVRVLYDFKIDKTIVALVPNDKEAEIGIDVLMERIDQEPMTTQVQAGITSQKDGGEGSTVYGVMTFNKSHLTKQGKSEQEKLTYWISFPFDVRLSDIFGFGAVGKYWMIKFYDGASRAANGLYDDNTYWKFITNSKYVLKANQGYVLSLDKKVMDPNSTIYTNREKISLYFPSKEKITDIDQDFTTPCNIPEHKCDITSPTDRRIYDSNWNLIGVPSYGNHKKETNAKNVTYFYDYNHASDSYTVAKNAGTKTFQAMFAYMVQFAGTINWETFTFIENGAQGLAAKKANAAYNQHNLRLELQQSGSKLDHTFIQLQDEEATEMFDMNSDLCKIINAGSNIYSIITTESTPIQVAGNVMPIQETIIPIGVVTSAAGEYTFAMPEGTDGIVIELIDYEANTRTNMLLDEYTVNLGKGTFENRFALHVKPNKTTTSLEDVNTNTTGVKKYLIDGILYMQKDGALYDAQGKLVR